MHRRKEKYTNTRKNMSEDIHCDSMEYTLDGANAFTVL